MADSKSDGIGRHILFGGVLVATLVVGVGGWAAVSELSGAVVAPGTIVVDSASKKLQHAEGGVVAEIHARDGMRVQAGDLLVRLDDTVTRANLMLVENELVATIARRARLEAERDGLAKIAFPPALLARRADPVVEKAVIGETNLFAYRRDGRAGQVAQLRERVVQLGQETVGLRAQIDAKGGELALIASELADISGLYDKKLVTATRVTALRRESTRITGERAQLVAELARSRGRIAETELQILQITQDFHTDVARELREAETTIADRTERKVAADDRLMRLELRAPIGGIVHQSSVHTVGGVLAPRDTLMLVVPQGDALTIEARVAATDIDQVYAGQSTMLRFPGLNQRTTPEVSGHVQRVGADLTVEPQSGQSYYLVRIALADAGLEALAPKLVPGMPAEVMIQTGTRTALSYLVKPVSDQLARAFREE